MTVALDHAHRAPSAASNTYALEDRFEVLKEIGDGSFGSVVLARVRTAGAQVARRGTVIAIKTMKKTFESFAPCMDLREVVFLRTLPTHSHLVPALDIFLDPFTKKLHICMEYMEGNLYQLMKARDHKHLDNASVKSILFQIMLGLEHIHAHNFFHRDIKPENILVSTSSHSESTTSFRRYSSMVTPPSTPPSYTVKIADFGLARETHSKLPYTTYVSTRWYRAPEVLLRAGEYSAPVDIWAVGAMAVEVATLKPLFPGGNEVDQVWRVCEIMGSPGNWYNKTGSRVGGGEWREGTRLAGKLGFSFPKMAPHAMDTILQAPQWPTALSQFVTWCLMWDPKTRPTSAQALAHEYFADAVDPLRPKSSASRILGRKQSDISRKDSSTPTPSATKPSWFRKSLIGRSESSEAVAVPAQLAPAQHHQIQQQQQIYPPQQQQKQAMKENIPPAHPVQLQVHVSAMDAAKARPPQNKRTTWTNGISNVAPMPILPTIRPISPFPNQVNAQAGSRPQVPYNDAYANGAHRIGPVDEKASKKIGRQLSVASSTNHYTEMHRQQAERALNGGSSGLVSPNGQREGFFSHLRKRARRFSGRHQTPISPAYDDIEAQAGCGPWGGSNRSSMIIDQAPVPIPKDAHDSSGQNGQDAPHPSRQHGQPSPADVAPIPPTHQSQSPNLKRHHSLPHNQPRSVDNLIGAARAPAPVSSRTRRAAQHASLQAGVHQYDAPAEEDELLDEVLMSTQKAMKKLEREPARPPLRQSASNTGPLNANVNAGLRVTVPINLQPSNPYPTPSPSASGHALFGDGYEAVTPSKPMDPHKQTAHKWPTPPYEESDWASSVTASVWAAGSRF